VARPAVVSGLRGQGGDLGKGLPSLLYHHFSKIYNQENMENQIQILF
jgi:hypothetical protein